MSSFLMLLGPHRFRFASGLEIFAQQARSGANKFRTHIHAATCGCSQRQCRSAFNTYTDGKRSAPSRRCKWVCKDGGKMHCGWQCESIG